MNQNAAIAALQFYIDHGVDEALDYVAANKLLQPQSQDSKAPQSENSAIPQFQNSKILGKSEAAQEAIKIANAAQTLDELKAAIAEFEGIAIKKTASNIVFADGNPNAHVMLIGEAPGADEDRSGKPYAGANGALLDKILACINLSRTDEDPSKSVYISNILNWRPPGNRSPNPAEIAASLPFIERHIQLVQPKVIILCGGVAAKSLLNQDASISKLRKTFHEYTPVSQGIQPSETKPQAIVTYDPEYLLKTPIQKKAVWADMLMLQEKLKSL